MSEGDDAPARSSARPSLKERLEALLENYGRVALYTYLTLSLLSIAGFSLAIGIGAEPSSATGVIGVIIAGWAAAKVTLPIRILLTLAVTPAVAVVLGRRQRVAVAVVADEPGPGDGTL